MDKGSSERGWQAARCAAPVAFLAHVCCPRIFELRVPLPDVVAMQTRQPNLEFT
jgi:hypothetical protein